MSGGLLTCRGFDSSHFDGVRQGALHVVASAPLHRFPSVGKTPFLGGDSCEVSVAENARLNNQNYSAATRDVYHFHLLLKKCLSRNPVH